MHVTVKAPSELELSERDIRRLVNTIDEMFVETKTNIFTMAYKHNCAILKLRDISGESSVVATGILNAATVNLFTLAVEDEHCGWLFMLPQYGTAFTTPSGLIYTRPELQMLKNNYLKRVKTVEGEIQSLEPEIYLSHGDFSVCGLDEGAILLISRNATHVVTQ